MSQNRTPGVVLRLFKGKERRVDLKPPGEEQLRNRFRQ